MHALPHQTTYLPLTCYIAASPATAPNDDPLWEPPSYAVPTRSIRAGVLLMQIVGSSMDDGTERSIPHGSLVMVDTHDLQFHQLRRGRVYAFVAQDGTCVAKVYDLYKGRYALKSLHPDVPPITDFIRAGYQPVGLLYAVRESATQVRLIT